MIVLAATQAEMNVHGARICAPAANTVRTSWNLTVAVWHVEETLTHEACYQQGAVVTIPVLVMCRVCSDGDGDGDEDEFAMAFEVNRSILDDPHRVNLIMPSKSAINNMALPIEARCGVILPYVIAFLRMSLRMEEIDASKMVFIATKDRGALT